MTPKNALEIEGNFLAHPFAEIVAEIAQTQLDGSLRVGTGDKKCVVYFRGGRLVFAASNARESRLFDILLKQGKLTNADLADATNFQNDFELAAWLESKDRLSPEQRTELFKGQIEAIILDILTWPNGDWTFSSLARVRDGLDFEIDMTRVFIDYSRCMSPEYVVGRFRSMDECFESKRSEISNATLTQEESYILSCTAERSTPASELVTVAALPPATILHAIYTLWLGGFLNRSGWQTAFSGNVVGSMRHAKLELKREAKIATVVKEPEVTDEESLLEVPDELTPKPLEIAITLDEYLKRIESAATFYDILGVDPKAEIAEIRNAYFSLAKLFHPDRYHSEGGETFMRVQHAFTELTKANEALKNTEARDVYDYRMRKEIATREQVASDGESEIKANSQTEQALLSFDRGFGLLIEGDAESALPFLARAVHYDAAVARYHAYYGKALAADETKRHKAEAEIQTAIKLDPESPTFRILLAEFFIQYNLLKRAHGELTRLLTKFPDNREAQNLLESVSVSVAST